jgi:hypothetical protein
MDSDDSLEPEGLEELYNHAVRERADIIYFNGISFYESEELKNMHPEFVDYYNRNGQYPSMCEGTEMFQRMMEGAEYRVNVGIQFFRREFLMEHNLKFHPGILHEDNGFTFCAMLLAERTGFHDGAYFRRRVRGDSIMTKQVNFAHTYGYFCSYIDMLHFLEANEMKFPEEIMQQAYAVLRGVLDNAKNRFHELSDAEKYAAEGLRGGEKILFRLYVQSEERTFAAMKKAYGEKSELHAKLQRTYAEKSEINRKLQITYGEKFERGLEIKRLKQENARIRQSESYRLARIIGYPVRVLRRILKKIRNKGNQNG